MTLNEQILYEIKKLQNGDYSSYENFYNLTAQYIYKILSDIVGTSVADTLIADVYNAIYAGISQVGSVEFFYPWSGMIATDIAFAHAHSYGGIDYSCVNGVFENIFEKALEDTEAFIPDTILQDIEQQRLIQNTIDAMPITYKIVIQYYYYENLSLTDIAYKLNVSTDVIKKILSEIKNKLKVMLFKYNGNSTRFYSLAEVPLLWVVFNNILTNFSGMTAGAGAMLASVGAYQVAGSSAGAAVMGNGVNGVSGGGVVGSGNVVSGVGAGGTSGSGMILNGTAGGGAVGSCAIGGNAAGGVVSGGVAGTTGVAVAGGSATAASVGFFSTVAGKIVIGATLVATLGSGGVLIHNAVTNDDEPETGITTEISEVTEEATLTDATPTDMVVEVTTEEVTTEEVTTEVVELSDEEIYYNYIRDVLVLEQGLSDISYKSTDVFTFMDEFSNESVIDNPLGIMSAQIYDLDMDGSNELMVISVVQDEMNMTCYNYIITIYGISEGQVVELCCEEELMYYEEYGDMALSIMESVDVQKMSFSLICEEDAIYIMMYYSYGYMFSDGGWEHCIYRYDGNRIKKICGDSNNIEGGKTYQFFSDGTAYVNKYDISSSFHEDFYEQFGLTYLEQQGFENEFELLKYSIDAVFYEGSNNYYLERNVIDYTNLRENILN